VNSDQGRRERARVPGVLAGFLSVVAALCAVAAVSNAVRHGFQPVRWGIDQLLIPAPANLAYAAFLTLLAAAVARRKRMAHRLVVFFFALQLVTDTLVLVLWRTGVIGAADLLDEAVELRHPDSTLSWTTAVNLVLTVAALTLLVRARHQFPAQVRPASVADAVLALAIGLSTGIALGWGLVTLVPGTLRPSDRLPYVIETVFGSAIDITYDPAARPPGWVHLLLGTFGATALLLAMYTLFRAQRAAAVLTPADEARIRTLLATSGERDSLGYFATRRDKAVIFSPGGRAAVTYRVVAGVSVASGDPIGDPGAWEPAIAAWLAQARAYAWTPAVMGAGEQGAHAYARAGMKVLELGDEAIIDVAEFTLEGRDMRPVRQAVRRIERAGYTVRIRRHAELNGEETARVVQLADAWRDTAVERGFSMALSRLGDPADGECVLVEAVDPQGRPVGLLSFTPWGAQGLSLDLMRRDRSSDNGLTEYMVTALVDYAPKLDVSRISLNFAVFRSAFEEGARIGAGPVLRAWRRLLLVLSHWWQLESLYRSNAKYRPRWMPRYICFGEGRDLAKVALACAIAEGFLVLPGRRGPRTRETNIVPVDVPATAEATVPAGPSVPEQVQTRRNRLERIRADGVDPYPATVARTDRCDTVIARHPGLPPDTDTGERVSLAGRVILIRDHGRLCFATLRDATGDIQVMVADPEAVRRWKAQVDRGDHIAVSGVVVTSRRGDLTVRVQEWALVAKCLHPHSERHPAPPGAPVQAVVVGAVRGVLLGDGYEELDSPLLETVPGGLDATPLALRGETDARLYLRTSLRLPLLRRVEEGAERVFELGRVGHDHSRAGRRNLESTVLEAYCAYAGAAALRETVRRLVTAAGAATGRAVVRDGGLEHHLDGDWPVVSVHGALSAALGEEITPDTARSRLRTVAGDAGVSCAAQATHGELVVALYEALVAAGTTRPTFYTEFPTEEAPLARRLGADPRLTDTWRLVVLGTTLAAGSDELTDPDEQRRRLAAHALRTAATDPLPARADEELLHLLERALPPTAGLRLDVDRLVGLLNTP
jgi:lysyl-tRNA synthetase class 2